MEMRGLKSRGEVVGEEVDQVREVQKELNDKFDKKHKVYQECNNKKEKLNKELD